LKNKIQESGVYEEMRKESSSDLLYRFVTLSFDSLVTRRLKSEDMGLESRKVTLWGKFLDDIG
jgi:hypothetical protein